MLNKKKIRLKNLQDVKAFVAVTEQCDFDIDIYYNRVIIDAKSILGVLSLDLTRDLTVDYDGYNEALETFLAAHDAKNKAIA